MAMPWMRGVMFRPDLVPVTGDVASALVLSVALFEQERAGAGNPWPMSMSAWSERTGIKRNALMRARQSLSDAGLIVESHAGKVGRQVVEFCVDLDALTAHVEFAPVLSRDAARNGTRSDSARVPNQDGSRIGTGAETGPVPNQQGDGSRIGTGGGPESGPPYMEVRDHEERRESTPGARPRVAQAVPESGGPDPLPEHAEALVGQLVETLAARRQEYGKSSVKADTMAAAVAVTAKVFGPSLRSLAREHAEAWPHVAPLFVAGGPKAPTLHKGHSPTDLRMLQTLLDGWTPDQVQAAQGGRGNGKNRERVPDAPIEYAKPADFPYWRKDFKPTREQIAAGMGMTLAEFEAAEAAGAAS